MKNVRCAAIILSIILFHADLLSQSTTSILDNWCFQYKYDSRQRMTHKKIPGADWMYMVYDDRDRLVMTQDGNQRSINQWTFTRYDDLNRPIVTGVYTHFKSIDQAGMSALISPSIFSETFDGKGALFGYTNTVMPPSSFPGSFEPLAVTYYDNYEFLHAEPCFSCNGSTVSSRVIGQVTGTWTRMLGNERQWLRTVNYYDDKGRLVRSVTDNHKRGQDILTNTYDFSGKVLATTATSTDHHIQWKGVSPSLTVKEDRVSNNTNSLYQAAFSKQQIPIDTDGWVEFSSSMVIGTSFFGLSAGMPNSINYCIQHIRYSSALATIQVVENAIPKNQAINVKGDDIIRIERKGLTVSYSKNGMVFWTTNLTTRPALNAHVSLNNNSELYNPKISVNGITRTVEKHFEYDHAGRLTRTWHSIDKRDSVLISQNEYNELGQLVDKNLHSNDTIHFRQRLSYRYNIRGWLTSIDANLFGFDLLYNDISPGLRNAPVFSGNISAMRWTGDLTKEKYRHYKFDYDPMNRLTSASTLSGMYRESGLTYDLNGNIKTLLRTDNSAMLIDSLTYSYGNPTTRSNVLRKVSDSGTVKGFADRVGPGDDYSYDRNGNMTSDQNKQIASITYNCLNLPEKVIKNNGDFVINTYDATGRQLIQDVYGSAKVLKKRSDYRGDWFYENDTLKFIHHDEGRVIMTSTEPEYQYDLKDHLGNIRMTFTTKDEVVKSTANFETPTADFLYYNEAIKINSPIFDHTGVGPTYYSLRLNGSPKERFGLAKSLSVMPGDTIKMEVFAKYLDTNSSNWTSALTSLVTSIASGTALPGTFIDAGAAGSTGGVAIPWSGFLDKSSEIGDAPKAYLNYLVFDSDYNYVGGNFVPLTTNAREYGQDGPHEQLSCELPIKTAGYVYIYLSNDNVALGGQQVEVYFDEFKVEHVKSPVVQSQDYYPFGMVFNLHQREGSMSNQHQFNGRETQDELNLGWINYGSRMYASDIGRWLTNDGYSESYFSFSPYNYVRNNPVLRVDPTGQWDITVHLYNDREKYGYGIAIVTDRKGNEVYRFVVRAEGIGGRNRYSEYADTPLGVYDIPDINDTWRETAKVDRKFYGPNPRLVMSPESGEIVDTGRDAIRIHGGRQEAYNSKTGKWEAVDDPTLEKTKGCLRAFDSDMKKLKKITDDLMASDAEEIGGKVTVADDLKNFLKTDGRDKQDEETQIFWRGFSEALGRGLDNLIEWLKQNGF